MTGSILKLSEVKRALQKEKLNFKILNDTGDSVIFLDDSTKIKLRGKIVRSFNEGEVYHWPSLNHENIDRLIDILCIRDDLYIYLTIHHDMSLKNIVHDQDFVYEPRCFDRKRLYAKGIFSGLSYLHEKSLSLMNLCDDNIIISRTEDRAIITNFDHLSCERKSTKSRLNVPEMYMAPETEESGFDPIKAEIWASGTLMLDMFLAHMVPWATVGYKPKKVLKIVNNMSLDLLQAANAGSIVSAVDLEKFKVFLKRFFRQNPRERIPIKYAYIASFLQYRSKYKVHRDTDESASFPESALAFDIYNLDLSSCYDPTNNSESNWILQNTQKEEVGKFNDASAVETQQIGRAVEFGENESKGDISNTRSLKNNIKQENEENATKMTVLPFCEIVATIDNAEMIDGFQKFSKSWEKVDDNMKAETESSYNCYQSKSLTFIKPRNDCNTIKSKNTSNKSCYSNNKLLPSRQSVGSSDIDLNVLYNIDDGNCYENGPDDNKDGDNPAAKSGYEKVEMDKRLSEIAEKRHLGIETQIKQRTPSKQEYSAPVRTFERSIAIPPRNSNAPQIFISPEVESIINKIAFLRRCYVSIQAHQKIFISNEFASKQIRFIKEYKNLLYFEDLHLREKLIMKYKLKSEDVTKLMKYVNLGILSRGHQYKALSMSRNFSDIVRSNFKQTEGLEDAMKDNVKYFPAERFRGTNSFTMKPDRNHSYYKATENAENNHVRKWETNNQIDNEIPQKGWERFNFEPRDKMNNKFVSVSTSYHKITEGKNLDAKKKERVKEYENMVKCTKMTDEIQCNAGTRPKRGQDKNGVTEVEILKSPKIRDYSKKKEKAEMKSANQKQIKEKMATKSNRDKKMKKKLDKKEKNLRELKKQKEPKRSWFFSLCPGGKVEEPEPTIDTLCDTCKLNLEFT